MTHPIRTIDVNQLPLALRWPRRQRFEHFHAGENAAAVAAVQRAVEGGEAPWIYLAGPAGSGKTHLLAAACQAASEAGKRVQYLPLRALRGPAERAIRGSGGCDLLALDDVDALAGQREAEHALFDLYNRCRAEGATLLFAGNEPPSQLPLTLPDLRSRLGMCTLAMLRPLSEAERRDVLRTRAQARGIELDDAVLDWLFVHHARDLGALGELLEDIDRASLAAKRRVTVPFVRQLLKNRDSAA
nr:DnaA regulatory inactivator Hda [Oleiagrimonas citrea]